MKAIIKCLVVFILLLNNGFALSPSENRMKKWGTMVRQYLADNTATKYSAIEQFSQTYHDLDPEFSFLDLNVVTLQKSNEFKKFLKLKEELIQRIVEKAEIARKNSNIKDVTLTTDDVWFYKKKVIEGSEEDVYENETNVNAETNVKKIHYHNSKCRCGYQIDGVSPNEISNEVDCFEPRNGFRPSPHFKNKKVSFEETSVHIATEVYNGGKEVLQDIYLSDALHEPFVHGLCNYSDPLAHTTKWLYFASKSGIVRYFPGQPREELDCILPDLYDGRISSSYLQSASSPKDVVILLDNSGSIKGLTLNLIKRSVKNVLDTLTPNDFVNVILFNQNVTYILKNCENLLQATPANKQYLLKALDNFNIANKSDFELGFSSAFKMIDDEWLTDNNIPHAGCNSIVLLFTDGGAVYPENAVREWNNHKTHRKRVFSYAVGKNFYEIASVKNIACQNRGMFHRVPSFGATKEETQKYLLNISQPMAQLNIKQPMWTLPYPDRLGLGTIMSVSLPVYEKENSRNNFVGVIGGDVLLDDIKKMLRTEEMSQDYYIFGLDNNGFVFMHPDLKENIHGNVLTTDITEVESDKFLEIRKDMINQNSGNLTIRKQVYYEGFRYSYMTEFLYAYKNIQETAFSIATTAHGSKTSRINALKTLEKSKMSGMTLSEIDEKVENLFSYLYENPCMKESSNISICTYNEEDSAKEEVDYSNGQEINNISESCKKSSYYNLLLHGWVSKQISTNAWLSLATNGSLDGVLGMFFASETPSFLKLFFNNDEKNEDLIPALANPGKQAYYRRAVHSASDFGWIFSYITGNKTEEEIFFTTAAPSYTNTTSSNKTETSTGFITTTAAPMSIKNGYVVAARAVLPFAQHPMLAPAVVGVAINATSFQSQVFRYLTHDCDKGSLCNADMQIDCANTEETTCLLVDDGGFLIFSNQDSHKYLNQRFIGYIDGGVTRSLIKNGVYNLHRKSDTQSMCFDEEDGEPSSGLRSLFIPTITEVLSFSWWASTSAIIFLSTVLQTMFAIFATMITGAKSHISEIPGVNFYPDSNPPRFCHKVINILEFGKTTFYQDNQVQCEGTCNRSYSAIRVADTNLLMLVLDRGDDCDECIESKPLENEPVVLAAHETCSISYNNITRHRGTPVGECYDSGDIPEDKDTSCGTITIHISNILFFITLILIVLVIT